MPWTVLSASGPGLPGGHRNNRTKIRPEAAPERMFVGLCDIESHAHRSTLIDLNVEKYRQAKTGEAA